MGSPLQPAMRKPNRKARARPAATDTNGSASPQDSTTPESSATDATQPETATPALPEAPSAGSDLQKEPKPHSRRQPDRAPSSPAGWIGSFDQLFPATNDVACFREPGGTIIDASEAFQAKFGRRTDHWIGVAFEQIVHREDTAPRLKTSDNYPGTGPRESLI